MINSLKNKQNANLLGTMLARAKGYPHDKEWYFQQIEALMDDVYSARYRPLQGITSIKEPRKYSGGKVKDWDDDNSY